MPDPPAELTTLIDDVYRAGPRGTSTPNSALLQLTRSLPAASPFSWGHLGAILGLLGPSLGHLGANLGHHGQDCPKMTKMVPRRLGPTCGGSLFSGANLWGKFFGSFFGGPGPQKTLFFARKNKGFEICGELVSFHFFPRFEVVLGGSWGLK